MLFENPVPSNMPLPMQLRSAVTVDKMAGIFAKRIWQVGNPKYKRNCYLMYGLIRT